MPTPRKHLLSPQRHNTYYHCISRVVDRRFAFETKERDVFRKILRQVEAFSGVEVLTWTILSNHFHVLLHITPPPPEPLSNAEILGRCRALYSKNGMVAVEWEFEEAERDGGFALEKVRTKYLKRMWDLSEFMKTLKQKFTSWFNRGHSRSGTLWERRFKSVLVEGDYRCLLKIAAYIDLNSVRAGIVDDPKDYRWCGYSEAVAGDRSARKGLASALEDLRPGATWKDIAPRYRRVLFGISGDDDKEATSSPAPASSANLKPAEIAKVFAAGAKLSLPQLLRCRVRHFTDGLVLGSESFVDHFFSAKRATFSPRRTSGSRKLGRGSWGGMRCARALSRDPITPPCRDG